MAVYADPTRCPDCRTTLPPAPTTCPACTLPLTGPLVERLFSTLQSADRLLAEVRASAQVPQPYPAPYPAQPAGGQRRAVGAERRGLAAPSVPTILLGLGALCLLVAAVTFLAFAWSWLGVGGRTAVLLALTAGAGAGAELLRRRGLRIAGESVALVALGLLVLDVLGAGDAGWLGDLGAFDVVTVLGVVVATPTAAWTLLAAAGDERPLAGPQVAGVLGVSAVAAGWAGSSGEWYAAAALATALCLALVLVARRLDLAVTAAVSGATAALWWLPLTLAALGRATEHASLDRLVGDAEAWPLVVSALLLVAATLLVRTSRAALVGGFGSAGALVTLAPLVVAADNHGADLGVVLVVSVLVWSAAAVRLPSWGGRAAAVPLGVAASGAAVLAGVLLVEAITPVLRTAEDIGEHAWTVRLGAVPDLDPLGTPGVLLVPLVATLVLAALAVRLPRRDRHPALPAAALPAAALRAAALPAAAARAAAGALLTGAAVAASYESPLALVLALLVLAGLALVARADTRETIAGALVLLGALAGALASVGLTATVATVALAAAVAVRVRSPRGEVAALAGLLAPALFVLAGWSVGDLVGLPEVWRAAPLVLVLGVVAIHLTAPEVEVGASGSGALVAVASVTGSVDVEGPLAAYLTLGGVLVVASSVVNAERRGLAWVGGALLAGATWVRLLDAGVTTPEAYTMPSALALVTVGLVRLARDADADTWSTVSAGLLLATVPSLVTVMTSEPASLRALLLGLGCLALVLGGAAARWSAPLLVGAGVGAVLVLREWGPYAADVPPWVVIGLAGGLLLVVGVTWEARLQELRRGAAYLGRLR